MGIFVTVPNLSDQKCVLKWSTHIFQMYSFIKTYEIVSETKLVDGQTDGTSPLCAQFMHIVQRMYDKCCNLGCL
jgi:hypothetical protein